MSKIVISPNWDLLVDIDNKLWFQRCAFRENHNCGFDCVLCGEPIRIKHGSGHKFKISLCQQKDILVDEIEDKRILHKHSELYWDENKYGLSLKTKE